MPNDQNARSRARSSALEQDLDQRIEHLSRPEAYHEGAERVKVLQTHISVLFFVGRRVYKLKKPVALDFLDYTDVAERRRFCEEEVRLNRRISPAMYLGVRPVTREDGGRLAVDGDGEAVDWVVEMVRLPAERMLDALLDGGELGAEQLDRVAAVLARFHDRAMTGPAVNRHGLSTAVAAKVHENLEQLEAVAAAQPEAAPASALAFLAREVDRFLRDHRDLMERRVGDWRIREGHGDLHAGNVCLVDDEVFVYDCVEFDRRLRCGDVASDLAFLAMDLDHRGHPDAARQLVARYAELASDEDLAVLVDFYKVHRALVRAKVELLRAADERLADDERRAALAAAASYVQLAVAYRLPPCLVVVGATDHDAAASSPADHVAGRLRAELLRDDERERRALVQQAAALLERDQPVVVDADGLRGDQRPYLDAAGRLGVPLFAVQLDDGNGTDPSPGVPPARTVRLPGESAPERVGRELQERMIAALE